MHGIGIQNENSEIDNNWAYVGSIKAGRFGGGAPSQCRQYYTPLSCTLFPSINYTSILLNPFKNILFFKKSH